MRIREFVKPLLAAAPLADASSVAHGIARRSPYHCATAIRSRAPCRTCARLSGKAVSGLAGAADAPASGSSALDEARRDISHSIKPSTLASTMLVDTLAMMKQFEEHGLNRQQAEALTRHLTTIILAQSAHNKEMFVSSGELERVIIKLEAQQKQFQQEMQIAHDMHSATMSKEADQLTTQLEKFKADIKHEVDKLTANQKLDLNLERGRLRDDLQQVRDKVTVLRTALEREVNVVRTDMESSKSDTLKWVVVTVVGLLGAGFAAIRLSLTQ